MERKDTPCIVAQNILVKLLEERDHYFSDGYLNSEGVKLLNVALRYVTDACPKYTTYLKKLRKTKSYEDLLRVLEVFEVGFYPD